MTRVEKKRRGVTLPKKGVWHENLNGQNINPPLSATLGANKLPNSALYEGCPICQKYPENNFLILPICYTT